MTGNLVFFPIGSYSNFVKGAETKYQASSVHGELFAGEIYTEKEIRTTHPTIKECDGLLKFADTYKA